MVNKQIVKAVAAFVGFTVLASFLHGQAPVSKPIKADVTHISPANASLGIEAGDIKLTFADGHSETIGEEANCMRPHLSPSGNTGWIRSTGFDEKGYGMDETLVVRLIDGTQKEFRPNPKGIFIEDWGFADNDSAVVIMSRGRHGPASFIRYDLATGRIMYTKDGTNDSEPMPQWAQAISRRNGATPAPTISPLSSGNQTWSHIQPTNAILVDPASGEPAKTDTYSGSVKVQYSDGHAEIFGKDGKCADPRASRQGYVGWTHYTHRGPRNAPMDERLVILFPDTHTKEFRPNPHGGPFIEEWKFVDNDSAVVIKSRGYHGPASFVRYNVSTGAMTGHQDGYVEYEKMPKWAQPFSDDIPFGLVPRP